MAQRVVGRDLSLFGRVLVWKRKHWLIGAFGLHRGALRSLSISIDLRFHPILLRTPSGSFYHSLVSHFFIFLEKCLLLLRITHRITALFNHRVLKTSRHGHVIWKVENFQTFSAFLTSKCRMKLTILRKYGVGYLMSNRFESLLSF